MITNAQMDKIVAAHTGLVKSVALRLSYVYGEELDDLIQIGYIGLIKAAKRFEPERGLKFSTYAVPLIAGEIRSEMRDQGSIKVSRSLKTDGMIVRRAENDYITQNGESPHLTDLIQITGFSAERITQALAATDALKNFEDYEKINLWTDNEENNIDKMDIHIMLSKLPLKERSVITLRYYKDYTQQQVADILGISQVQVCRIEKNALRELAQKISV